MKRIEYLLLRIAVVIIGLLPFWLLYRIADVLYMVLLYVIQYRRKIILANLRNAFPDITPADLSSIARKYYKNLADIMVESLKGLSLDEASLRSRYKYKNPEIFQPHLHQGKHLILLGSHIANWEWGVLSFPLWVSQQVAGIYKPLSNKYVEDYLNTKRTRYGLKVYPMSQIGRAILLHKNEPAIFVLIADQTPSDTGNADWIKFLHQDTPFLHGPGKLAVKTGYPLYMFDIQRIRRGCYEVEFKKLDIAPASLKPHEVTQKYARQLEMLIRKAPSNWLWSHRRWKHRREVTK